MRETLSREQVIDLLYYLGTSKVVDKPGNDNIQFNCTVHGESNPSAGFSVEKQCFNCLSCHASGGVEWLVMQSLPEEFPNIDSVDRFIKQRYGVDLSKVDLQTIRELRRYGEDVQATRQNTKKIQPKYYIAPYKSGKETYKYFFDRGFTKETMQKFKIGRDLENKTVTVPVFYDDETELAGMIGRYIDPNRPKNQRYKIYDVDTGTLVFPQDKCKPIDGVLIVVEGLLDAVYMHQLGYTNTFATLTNSISDDQIRWLKKQGASKLLDMTDNDEMGVLATDIIKNKVKKYIPTLRVIYTKNYYPKGTKDPQDLSYREVKNMVDKSLASSDKIKLVRRK